MIKRASEQQIIYIFDIYIKVIYKIYNSKNFCNIKMMYYYNNNDIHHNYCMIIDEYNNYYINISYEDCDGICKRYSFYTNINKDNIKNNIYDIFVNRIQMTTMKNVPNYIKNYIIDIIKKEYDNTKILL